MKHWKLTRWCGIAVGKIRYTPDRNAVFEELQQHIDDRSDAFLELGMEEDAAIEKTLEVMGAPEELAPMLAAIHRPYWGYAYSTTKWILRLTAIAALICIIFGISDFLRGSMRQTVTQSPYAQFENPDVTRTLYLEPNCSDASDGYTFTVTRAAVQHYIGQNNAAQKEEYDFLFVELKISNYLPWAYDCKALNRFHAVDSLGNHYKSASEYYVFDPSESILHSLTTITPFTQCCGFMIPILHLKETEWIELRYDDSGRDIVFHLRLAGGDST